MQGGDLKGGRKEFFTARGVERGPAEQGGVLESLAATDLGLQGRQADTFGQVVEIAGEDGATLHLIEENTRRFARREVATNHGHGILRGPEIGGGG